LLPATGGGGVVTRAAARNLFLFSRLKPIVLYFLAAIIFSNVLTSCLAPLGYHPVEHQAQAPLVKEVPVPVEVEIPVEVPVEVPVPGAIDTDELERLLGEEVDGSAEILQKLDEIYQKMYTPPPPTSMWIENQYGEFQLFTLTEHIGNVLTDIHFPLHTEFRLSDNVGRESITWTKSAEYISKVVELWDILWTCQAEFGAYYQLESRP
jgi:hypothetical protein